VPIVHPYGGELNCFDGRIEIKGTWVLPRRCPCCNQGYLIRWGSYWRSAYADGGSLKRQIRVVRMRCKKCKRTMAVLPQFVAPYQRVITSVREQIVQLWALGRACGAWLKGRALA